MRNLAAALVVALLLAVPAQAQEVPEIDDPGEPVRRGPRRALSAADREKALQEAEERRKAEEEAKRVEAEADAGARTQAEAEAKETARKAEEEKKRLAAEEQKRKPEEKKPEASQRAPSRRVLKPGTSAPAAATPAAATPAPLPEPAPVAQPVLIPASSLAEAQKDPRFRSQVVAEDARVKVVSVSGGFPYFGILDNGCGAGKVFVTAELLSAFDGAPAGSRVVLRIEDAKLGPARKGASLAFSGLRRAGKGNDGTFVYCSRGTASPIK